MTTLIPPRYELPIVQDEKGRISREWYKYLVLLGNSLGGSTTVGDDIQLSQVIDDASIEALALIAEKTALQAVAMFLLSEKDSQITPKDTSLLAWWPGNQI